MTGVVAYQLKRLNRAYRRNSSAPGSSIILLARAAAISLSDPLMLSVNVTVCLSASRQL